MARANEGLEPVSDALDAEAARDTAEAEMLRAAYTERVARANLDFAVGEGDMERDETRFADIEKKEE